MQNWDFSTSLSDSKIKVLSIMHHAISVKGKTCLLGLGDLAKKYVTKEFKFYFCSYRMQVSLVSSIA